MKSKDWRRTWGQAFWVALVVTFCACGVPTASAQDNVGGHIGFVIPWITRAGGQTTTVADNFTIGFPVGVTFKSKGHMNLDLEMVAAVSDRPRVVGLTVDPGVVWGLNHGLAVGIRAAFDINSSQFGFIPLVNKSWKFKNQNGFFKAYFVEADVPVKFNRPTGGPSTNPVTFATHFGLGF